MAEALLLTGKSREAQNFLYPFANHNVTASEIFKEISTKNNEKTVKEQNVLDVFLAENEISGNHENSKNCNISKTQIQKLVTGDFSAEILPTTNIGGLTKLPQENQNTNSLTNLCNLQDFQSAVYTNLAALMLHNNQRHQGARLAVFYNNFFQNKIFKFLPIFKNIIESWFNFLVCTGCREPNATQQFGRFAHTDLRKIIWKIKTKFCEKIFFQILCDEGGVGER